MVMKRFFEIFLGFVFCVLTAGYAQSIYASHRIYDNGQSTHVELVGTITADDLRAVSNHANDPRYVIEFVMREGEVLHFSDSTHNIVYNMGARIRLNISALAEYNFEEVILQSIYMVSQLRSHFPNATVEMDIGRVPLEETLEGVISEIAKLQIGDVLLFGGDTKENFEKLRSALKTYNSHYFIVEANEVGKVFMNIIMQAVDQITANPEACKQLLDRINRFVEKASEIQAFCFAEYEFTLPYKIFIKENLKELYSQCKLLSFYFVPSIKNDDTYVVQFYFETGEGADTFADNFIDHLWYR